MSFRSFFEHERGGFAPRRARGGARGRARGGARGGARGRARGGTHPFFERTAVKPDVVKHPLGQLLQTFSVSELENPAEHLLDSCTITNCEYVASYSWTAAKIPTITVPGRPPLWTPLQEPQRLKEDNGIYFRDPNSAKYPEYPTEPAVRALFNINPAFATAGVDIFACGSTMGNLLRFARSIDKPFRFNVELIGSTVFLVRKENDPRETIEGVRGFGHSFPEAYTTWEEDVKGSETHQRLCKYKLGRFNCIVRFECDGYLPHESEQVKSLSILNEASNVEDLLGIIENINVGQHKLNSSPDNTLSLKQGGTAVSQRTIFDLKTRSGRRHKKEIDMEEFYPQLWIKQIPNFIIAYHDGRGTFPNSDIHVQDVKCEVQAWERQNEAAIRRLGLVLEKIINLAKQGETGLLEVYCPSVGRLEIRRQYAEGTHALPPSLRAKWKDVEEDLALSDSEGDHQADQGGLKLGYDSDEEPDYTACGDDCAYCGKCTY